MVTSTRHTQTVISIHVLRVEDDWPYRRSNRSILCISIHVLRVEDDVMSCGGLQSSKISIHVLRVEDDPAQTSTLQRVGDFNPRPPCGGRPKHMEDGAKKYGISIHVLRVEDDS